MVPPFNQVVFVGGDNGGYAVGYSAPAVGGSHSFRAWPLGFTQNADPLEGTATLTDPGVGFIAAGGANHVYYFGQQQSCDGDGAQDSCVTICTITSDAMLCQAAVPLTNGSHVNGAVMVRGATPMDDKVYFAEAYDFSTKQLWQIPRECLDAPGPPCTAEVAANYNAPDNLDPLGMDSDPVDGSVWWNTWGGNGLTGACVYQYPAMDALLQCLQTVPPIAHPNRLALSANNVFVGSFNSIGPIQRVGRCEVAGQHPVTELSGVAWPADADGEFLYAARVSAPNELRVVNANTGQLVKSLLAQTDITSIDASHPDFLFYAAADRIYRWRKPPSPCAAAPAMCGNGCVDVGEVCDDGNDNGGDGCSATCECELPSPP
jgi:cysteine-rich repeat protein